MALLGNRESFVDGYPNTAKVCARRVRSPGAWLRRSGPVVLSNGSNAFVINDPTRFAAIVVNQLEGGVYAIQGQESLLAVSGDSVSSSTLAKFGNERAAKNGHAALLRAMGAAGWSSGGGKWTALPVLAGLFLVSFVLMAAVAPADPAAMALGGPLGGPSQPLASSPRGLFNSREPSIDELASGAYSFQPKLKAPVVAAPALSCPAKSG